MKIALICTEKLPVPPVAGGAVQIYIDGIGPFLSQRHHITVFSIQYPGLPEVETKNNVSYVRLPGNTGTAYLKSLKAAIDSSFDLVHVFNRPKYALELMELLPNTRFSLSLHNEMFHPEKISDADALKLIDRLEFINTVSKYISDTVTNRFPGAARKMHVVYSGVDSEYYKPPWSQEGLRYKNELKRKYGLQGYKIVLFVGRLSVKKGVDILLKAMDKVMRTNPKTALVVIGSKWYGKNEADDYTKSLQAISRNLSGPIHFTGFIPPADIPLHYTMGDVFVCPSQWMEPLARVHYEAMAAGLPIITTDRGGNAEVIAGYGNGIVMKEASSADEMAGHILYLLSHEAEAVKMGHLGRKLAEQKYNWKRVAEEVFQEFEPAGGSGFETGGITDIPVMDIHMPAAKYNTAAAEIAVPNEKAAVEFPAPVVKPAAAAIEVPTQKVKPAAAAIEVPTPSSKPAAAIEVPTPKVTLAATIGIPTPLGKPDAAAAEFTTPAVKPAAFAAKIPALDIEPETALLKIHAPVAKTDDITIEFPEPDIGLSAAASGHAASAGKPSSFAGDPVPGEKAAAAGSFSVPATKSAGTAVMLPAPSGKPYATGWKFPAAAAGRAAAVTLLPPSYTKQGSGSADVQAGTPKKSVRPENRIVRFGNGKHLG